MHLATVVLLRPYTAWHERSFHAPRHPADCVLLYLKVPRAPQTDTTRHYTAEVKKKKKTGPVIRKTKAQIMKDEKLAKEKAEKERKAAKEERIREKAARGRR